MLLVYDSREAESGIQTGKWMWWQLEEDGEEINNMGLPIAIIRYASGPHEVAVLRGVEVAEEEPSRGRRQTRVVCAPECWIIEVENIGSAVTEEENKEGGNGYGRVATTNSKGERFSLDRYHLFTPSKPRCSVRNHSLLSIRCLLTCVSSSTASPYEPPNEPRKGSRTGSIA